MFNIERFLQRLSETMASGSISQFAEQEEYPNLEIFFPNGELVIKGYEESGLFRETLRKATDALTEDPSIKPGLFMPKFSRRVFRDISILALCRYLPDGYILLSPNRTRILYERMHKDSDLVSGILDLNTTVYAGIPDCVVVRRIDAITAKLVGVYDFVTAGERFFSEIILFRRKGFSAHRNSTPPGLFEDVNHTFVVPVTAPFDKIPSEKNVTFAVFPISHQQLSLYTNRLYYSYIAPIHTSEVSGR